MKRRTLLAAAAAGAVAGTLAARPRDRGAGGHDSYFAGLQRELRAHGLARPTMLVDLDRLDHNIAELQRWLNPAHAYRVVAKSLPSLPLLEHVMAASDTRRLMVFHQPFLNAIAAARPDADLLLGKPMPAAAAAAFYAGHRGDLDPARQLQWLIDSEQRLAEYRELAEGLGIAMRINVEIDVGLHRGGLRKPSELQRLLSAIDAHPRLQFSGLMGYEPHVAKAPPLLGLQRRAFADATERYRQFIDAWRRHSGRDDTGDLTLNAAGSPTFRLWKPVTGIANELAAGSGLVKPTDFDIPTLDTHRPAAFIAAPVLKAGDGMALPIVPAIGKLQAAWNPNRRRSFFIYGGYWKAHPESPAGLSVNPLYGRSTNQELLNGSPRVALDAGDHVFLRPTQSEFVMLQFGDLAVIRGGRIVDAWPVLPG